MSRASPHHSPVRPPLQSPSLVPSTATPSPAGTTAFASALSYFTEPVSYTVSGLLRRLSEDEAPTALAKALSANYNGSLHETAEMFRSTQPAATPARRKSPFQPPPLTPLTLEGYKDSTHAGARLLRHAVAEEIRLLIPPRLQLSERWQLAYSLEQHGSTLSTLYAQCDVHRGKRGGFVVVVRDAGGGVFGAYLSDPPAPNPHYYGSGECFLWRAVLLPSMPDLSSLPPPPSADTTHLGRMTTVGITRGNSTLGVPTANDAAPAPLDQFRFKAFPYTGENDFSIFCQNEYLSVGGGDGHYGLWLGNNLRKGVSETCLTFGNERLSDEGSKFEVLGVEVWYMGS